MKTVLRIITFVCIIALLGACSPAVNTPADPQQPGNENPSTDNPIAPTPEVTNLLLDKNSKRNTNVLPRGIDKDHEWIKSTTGNSFTFYYPAEQDAFTYSNGKTLLGESTWMRSLATEYDIRLHAVRKAPASALSAQRLALLSDLPMDLMAFTPAQLPYTSSMIADASALLDKQKTSLHFLNSFVLSYGGGKNYFTPVGIARNLWYTAEGTNSPLSLSESGLWDIQAFTNYIRSRVKSENGQVSVYGYEVQDFTDLLAAMGTPLISGTPTPTNTTPQAKENIQILQHLNQDEGVYYSGQNARNNAPALTKRTLAIRYGQTPFIGTTDDYPKFEWAPLPTAERHQGPGKLSACAPILALPHDGTKNEIALNVALLWCARFADANHDQLRFTYGMSFDIWQKYYYATNENLQIVLTADETTTRNLLELVTAPTWRETLFEQLCADVTVAVSHANERLPQ